MDTIESKAHQCWEVGKKKEAFALFSECAAQGHDDCMVNLGYFYDTGVGTRKNKDKAMLWYRRAYRKGNAAAASNIAVLYEEQRKFRLSLQWFQRAARLGDGDAEVEVGKMQIQGCGVRRSIRGAKESLLRATSSKFITEAGREEAVALLREVKNGL